MPERYQHLVRYYGYYSSRSRGERAKRSAETGAAPSVAATPEPALASRARASWARLIKQVYEADPLLCSRCTGPMRVIALIDDAPVIERILRHLGQWDPRPPGPGPPEQSADWPRGAQLPLTYHPLPDIA